MKRQLVIRREAEQDLHSAWEWYEATRAGLGDEFLLCVEAALERVHRDPHTFPIVHRTVRRVLVRRFPYGAFYVVEPERLVVLAILHCHREPLIWQLRR